MPQIKFPVLSGEQQSNPLLFASLNTLEKGLKFSSFTPVLTNVTTPASLVGLYQLCGKLCFVSIKLDYTGVAPTWAATPTVTLPIRVSATLGNLAEPLMPIYNVTNRVLLNYAAFDTTNLDRLILPAGAGPAINKVYNISGFYWVD